MKVALVGPFPSLPEDVKGGVASVMLALAQGLSACGCDVHVVSTSGITGGRHFASLGNFAVHAVERTRPGFLTYSSVLRSRIHKKLREIQPEIAHFHGAAGLTFCYKKPHVLTIHGVNEMDVLFDGRPFGRIRNQLIGVQEHFGRRRCKNVIVISPYIKDLLAEDIRGTTWEIDNPVDECYFNVSRFPNSTIFFGGMISPRKNLLGLLKVFVELLRCMPATRLRIAGPETAPTYAAECRRLVKESGLSDRVEFLGPLTANQICAELSTAGCLALLSYQETAPVIIAEAMAAGVPVVASRVGGIPYMVDDGRTGFLVDLDKPKVIASRIVHLLSNPSKNCELGQRAHHVAKKKYKLSEIIDATTSCYRYILNN